MLRMKKHLTGYALAACLALYCGNAAGADSCVTTACHQNIAALKNPHQPVNEGDCSSCHRRKTNQHPLPGGRSFEAKAQGAVLCNQCHETRGRNKYVHGPVKEGSCISCHNPHGNAFPNLLDVGADQAALCFGCHDNAMMKEKYMHGPAAVGECTKCHDPHDSTEKALQKGPVQEICLKCHADFAKAMKEAPVVHPPVRDEPCTACHSPHGTPYVAILKEEMPTVCTGCHTGIGETLAKVKTIHKPLQQAGGCSNCHSAHYAQAKGLLIADQSTTCLGCHGTDTLGKPPLRNIKKDIAGKKFLHGPISQKQCTPCHDPHGSDFFRMLRGNYPQELYVPYENGTFALCLQCHDKELASAAETTKATNFRNGSRNLHSVHVLGRKGRTCRLCHEPHASNGEKLINKEGMKFGAWKVPINFIISPKGGTCAPGCHRSFRYDRDKPERY